VIPKDVIKQMIVTSSIFFHQSIILEKSYILPLKIKIISIICIFFYFDTKIL